MYQSLEAIGSNDEFDEESLECPNKKQHLE